MNKILGWLKSGAFTTAAGIVLVAILIWLGGPYVGIGDRQPLTAPAARLALILAIVLVWLAVLQWRQWRARQQTKAMATELTGQEQRLVGSSRDDAERTRLRERFEEAIATLRRSRRGGRQLYALPWYVVIGPPGSGKSTLLQNSGLEFPLAERFGRDGLRGIGGTRDCDWWFADEAVFIDTAGRYTTQDSDAAADASAWLAFLGLLRRYRRRRPLNGVIVTMSVAELLMLDEPARQQHIRAVRRRLDELGEQLKIGVPVYLVFTKCDLVAGFGEFFDDLGPELRSQVWGMTFPVDATIDGSAAKGFGTEFDLLLDRLNTRVIERLHAERDPARRAAVLSFPQQLGALKAIADGFVDGVFLRHPYGRTPLLRGAYFTSGTQEGTPIDRMLAAVARTFGVDAARLPPMAAPRRTFFVERLLKEVLFPESGFAGLNPQLERRKALMQAGAYAGFAGATALLVLGMATSFARNRAYVEQVQDALKDYPAHDDLVDAASLKLYFARGLQRWEMLADAQSVADQHQDHVPWSMRFGLYQGDALGEQVHEAYLRELNGSLLPGVGVRFREGLTQSASDPQALYYYLKGYLMLGQPEHLDAGELAALARIEWERLFPQDPAVQKALDKHFQALLGDTRKPRALSLDNQLVTQARATLQAADLSTLVYGSVKLDADRSGAPPLRLDQELGLLGNVFRRRSGISLAQPLPALFTRTMFAAEVGQGIDRSVDRFAKDDWVFGSNRIDPLARSRLEQQVLAQYQRDYIQAWDGLLADLELQPIASIQDASALAAKLSGPSSPLKALLSLVRDNTSDMLRAAPPGQGSKNDAAGEQAKKVGTTLLDRHVLDRSQLVRELKDAGATLPGEATPGQQGADANDRPGAVIEEHFAAIDRLTDGGPGAAPIDRTIATLDQLGKALLTMRDFSDPSVQNNPAVLAARQESAQLPPQVAGLVGSLSGRSEALVASGTSGAIGDAFRQAAGSDCGSFVTGRYPFEPGSTSDIPVQNFGDLFGNGGRFDTFFKQNLVRLVDTGGRNWRWKPGVTSGPAAVLAQTQLADAIRQDYFRNGATPEVDFSVSLPTLDSAIAKLQIDIDGQKVEIDASQLGRATAMKWPGPQPGHVSVTALDASGAAIGAPLTFQGDWAFFHAMDAGHLQRQGDLHFEASFTVGGHPVKLDIKPGSLKNPFDDASVHRFRCAG